MALGNGEPLNRDATRPPLEAADVLEEPVVDIVGIPMRLTASDDRRAGAVAALFRHASASALPPRCMLRFMDRELPMPADAPTTIIDDVQLWRPEPGHLLLRSAEGLDARVTPDEILIGGDAASIARVFRYVCLVALAHLLAQHGQHVLHGGAIVCEDRALLVLGDTGTGKSTLVFGALRLGWPVLADDLVAVHRRASFLDATGLPRPISIPPDVIGDEFPDGRSVPEDLRNRVELPGPTLAKTVHPIAGVLVTAHGAGPDAALEPMDGHETLRTVLHASTSLADPVILPEVFATAGALARLPAWSLRHGSDPMSRVHEAGLQLEKIAHQLGSSGS
jgi:hypothetical protein